MSPGFSGIRRFVYSVAGGKIRYGHPFAAADIEDVRVGWRYGYPADRAGGLIIENRLPRSPGIGGLPQSTIADANIERVGLFRNSCHRLGAAAAIRSNRAPPEFGEKVG